MAGKKLAVTLNGERESEKNKERGRARERVDERVKLLVPTGVAGYYKYPLPFHEQ